MLTKLLTAVVAIGSLAATVDNIRAAEPAAAQAGVELSPDLANLLRREMREIAAGVQGVGLAMATADWKAIAETSARIRASYIMEKKLTPAQAEELEARLPAEFKRLDAEFHQRAERLGAAAAMHDAEVVAFQYSRLLESCANCHAAYARARFPGFARPDGPNHSRPPPPRGLVP